MMQDGLREERSSAELGMKKMAGETARRFEFKAGQRIFSEGDPADYCYQVFRGKVQIVLATTRNVGPIAIIGPGEVFGEMGIIDDGPRSAAAVAVEDTMCVGYTSSSLLEQIERDPSTTVEIMKTLIRRLRESNQRFSSLDAHGSTTGKSRADNAARGWISRMLRGLRQKESVDLSTAPSRPFGSGNEPDV